jgi:glycogen debranching enzyme
MAHRHEVPQTPYYGSIDATLLFLILIGRHAAWTGDLKLFNDLRGPIEKALTWVARYGDHNGDGYIEYRSASIHGLANQ